MKTEAGLPLAGAAPSYYYPAGFSVHGLAPMTKTMLFGVYTAGGGEKSHGNEYLICGFALGVLEYILTPTFPHKEPCILGAI